ncbi:MAG: hypothetical protein IJ439_07530 [Tyzzerella sp.]|nr:hypothetical protein [Tyzzerella sp.]
MDKHEYRVKTEQMLEYMRQKSYKQAMDIADAIDWRKVKNISMLCAVSEIYEYNGEYQKSRDILFLAYDRSPDSRKIIYRLGTLALKLGEVKEAADCYEEFVALAPKDPNQYVLKYKILKSRNASLEEQIEALEEFKKVEYVEKWAFELAKLYQDAGMTAECIDECDDLILWFSEGKYVYKAMELKMQYKPLTPLQQEKYNLRNAAPAVEEAVAEIPAAEETVAEVPAAEEAADEPIAEAVAVEAPVAEEVAVEVPVNEEVVAEALAVEAPVVEEKIMEEMTAGESAVEEKVVEEAVTEEKKEAPTLSIEEMLQEWEEKQKENAEMIRAKVEEVESEKAQEEAVAAEQVDVEEESILPDDIRQLMEELESESADIEAQKIKSEEEIQEQRPQESVHVKSQTEQPQEDKPLIQKVAEQLAALDVIPAAAVKAETAASAGAAVGDGAVGGVGAAVSAGVAGAASEVTEKAFFEEEGFEQVVSHAFEAGEVKEEAPGIKLGDTQSMAAVAKALKNNVEVEIPEEVEEEAEEERSQYDTGFIVQGRYDLEAQSAIGLKAGLTEEQKKLFSYFVPVHGMSEQIVEVLQNDKKCKSRYGTSRIGNLLIIGRKGSGKTVLAVDIVKAIQKARKLKQGKVGIVKAESLNKKDVADILGKLHGGAIIIEKASRLNRKTIDDMCEVMEGQTGELLVVLEDERKPLEKMLAAYPQFGKKFTSRLELPVFINDELVTFGQTYAKENGYKIDEMGILALYSRIDMLQRNEHVVTVADVKDILDEAIDNSQKASFKKIVKKVLGKNKDESDRILLREEDFK